MALRLKVYNPEASELKILHSSSELGKSRITKSKGQGTAFLGEKANQPYINTSSNSEDIYFS